ncbi:hypothetical protein F2Q68_00006058 [Brassica cretica]|uniref:ADP-ribosyl cyclase/cyclic ADP-ribose hydrolase n=1 Tax=Brassica cretica TaxID=69181 RepID=A0A8S9JI21_BRACR|nr:hypothetical protein F2Q68_00006058 [Brassica cretica]
MSMIIVFRETEAKMIEVIAIDVSNKLNNFAPSGDFNGLIGMESHITEMEPLLQLDSNEVRKIGILGPLGIGKTTIARYLFNQHSQDFQLSVFMDNIRRNYPAAAACSDGYSVMLDLQKQFMSQLTNEACIKVPHLGVVKDRLKDKKVLVVLDDVDQLRNLLVWSCESDYHHNPKSKDFKSKWDQPYIQELAPEVRSLVGRLPLGLRVMGSYFRGMSEQDWIEALPSEPGNPQFLNDAIDVGEVLIDDKAGRSSVIGRDLDEKITCANGFKEVAREVTRLVDKLPLGLRVMGSYFRGMFKKDWTEALPRLKAHLDRDGDIASILKFSYDALCDEDKSLFLHIACFFDGELVDIAEGCLAKCFVDVRHGLHVLAQKSLISIDLGIIKMSKLLVQLGRKIVREQLVTEPGKRLFLNNAIDIVEVLSDVNAGSNSVIGISHDRGGYITCTSERAFERLSNLQFLRIHSKGINPQTAQQSQVDGFGWFKTFERAFLITQLPLVSKNIIRLNFRNCFKLNQEARDLIIQTRTNEYSVFPCEEVPKCFFTYRSSGSSVTVKLNQKPLGKSTKFKVCFICACVDENDFPLWANVYICCSITSGGNALTACYKRVEQLFRGHLYTFEVEVETEEVTSTELVFDVEVAYQHFEVDITECGVFQVPTHVACSKAGKHPGNDSAKSPELVRGDDGELPSSIGNAINLKTLSLKGCSSMVKLPSSIWNIVNLEELNLENCSNLVEIPSLLRSEIEKCTKSDCSRGSGKIINRLPIIAGLLSNPQFEKNNTIKYSESSTNIEELDPWIGRILRLRRLVLSGMRKLVSLPQLPDSLLELDAENCESLERLHCSFPNQDIRLNFANCFKLNQEARDLIIQMPTNKYAVFPTEKVPICFSYRSSGSSLTVKLNRLPVGKSTKFKACILCAYDDENNFGLWETASVFCTITFGGNASIACNKRVERVLPGNLCTFEVEVETEEVPFEDFESSDIELVREDDGNKRLPLL